MLFYRKMSIIYVILLHTSLNYPIISKRYTNNKVCGGMLVKNTFKKSYRLEGASYLSDKRICRKMDHTINIFFFRQNII